MPDKVKCRDCAKLMVIDRFDNKPVLAPKQTRDRGTYDSHGQTAYTPELRCDADKRNFPRFTNQQRKQFTNCIAEEITCDEFRQNEGRSPQELEQMEALRLAADALAKIADIQSQLAEIKAGEFDWQKDQAGKVKDLEERFEAARNRRHTSQLVVQFLLALLAAVVALIASKVLPFF